MNASLIGLFGTLAALLVALGGAAYIVVKDYDESAGGYKQLQKLNTIPASNLELLIREYMDRDVMDPSATIDFLIAADLLDNPFEPHNVLTVYEEDHGGPFHNTNDGDEEYGYKNYQELGRLLREGLIDLDTYHREIALIDKKRGDHIFDMPEMEKVWRA